MSFVLILTHHITIFYVIPLLFIVYLVQRFIVRDKGQDAGSRHVPATIHYHIRRIFILVVILCNNELLDNILHRYLFAGQRRVNIVASSGPDYFIIIRSMYYIIFLFFALIGSWYILQRGRKNHLKECTIALSALIFTPLFIPGILDIGSRFRCSFDVQDSPCWSHRS